MRQLGRYKLVRELGRGAMGEVHEAIQEGLDRRVAVKVLPRWLTGDANFVERFRREAKALAKLNHPCIVTVYDVGPEADELYFAMELVEGESLDKVVARDGPMPQRAALRLMWQAVSGLAHAWAAGIVHRDLKPANLMLRRDGTLKIADFGLARSAAFDGGMTRTDASMGTPYYMSPEQGTNARAADLRSDIFSLGATFYHLLTGRVPFEGSSPIEVAIKISTAPLEPLCLVNPNVSPQLAAVIEKMLSKRPEERYQTARELQAALKAVDPGPVAKPATAAVPAVAKPPPLPPLPPLQGRVARPTPAAEPARDLTADLGGGAAAREQRGEATAPVRPAAPPIGLRRNAAAPAGQETSVLPAPRRRSRLPAVLAIAVVVAAITLEVGRAFHHETAPHFAEAPPGERQVSPAALAPVPASALVLPTVPVPAPASAPAFPTAPAPVPASPPAVPPSLATATDFTNTIGMKFVRIEPGEFQMGSPAGPAGEAGRFDNETQHKVKLTKPFMMGVTPVTQKQWAAVMGTSPSYFKGDDLPVDQVSWDDAVAFCRKLSAAEHRTYRLPTEAEWEYACRAGTKTAYYTGDGEAALGEAGWYDGNSDVKTHPVGRKKPNAWGLYDMLGNVHQWCSDGYADYPAGEATDPKGPPEQGANISSRVVRGGSWNDDPRICRAAFRCGNAPVLRSYNFGFRLCLDF